MSETASDRQPRADLKSGGDTKAHWYFISERYCVLCGRSDTLRERRYTPRPDEYWRRHSLSEGACGDHFC